jgi:hypothetical protein
MRKSRRRPNLDARRAFFKKTALLGAAALFGCRRRPTVAPPATETAAPRRRGRYRLTAHIRRYYERASL